MVEAKGGSFRRVPSVWHPRDGRRRTAGLRPLRGKPTPWTKSPPTAQGVIGRANIDFSGQEPINSQRPPRSSATPLSQAWSPSWQNGHARCREIRTRVEELHKFIEVMFPGPYTAYSNRLRTGDYYSADEPLFAVDLARKDMRHAMNLAAKGGARG